MNNMTKAIQMKKTIYMGVLMTLIVVFTGCASKPKVSYIEDKEVLATIKISNGSGYPSWAANESEAFRDALETAARATLNKEYKYFAIVAPQDISNLNGSIKNTAREVIEFCEPGSMMALNFAGGAGLHKCGTYNTNAKMVVALFNEEQIDFVVYNAQEVIDYYHAEDIYDDTDIEYIEGKI